MSPPISTAVMFIITFLCGAAYELGCTFWVYYAEKNKAGPAVGWSCFIALVTIVGVESFLKSNIYALAYILGFGAGTYIAIKVKLAMAEQDREAELRVDDLIKKYSEAAKPAICIKIPPQEISPKISAPPHAIFCDCSTCRPV